MPPCSISQHPPRHQHARTYSAVLLQHEGYSTPNNLDTDNGPPSPRASATILSEWQNTAPSQQSCQHRWAIVPQYIELFRRCLPQQFRAIAHLCFPALVNCSSCGMQRKQRPYNIRRLQLHHNRMRAPVAGTDSFLLMHAYSQVQVRSCGHYRFSCMRLAARSMPMFSVTCPEALMWLSAMVEYSRKRAAGTIVLLHEGRLPLFAGSIPAPAAHNYQVAAQLGSNAIYACRGLGREGLQPKLIVYLQRSLGAMPSTMAPGKHLVAAQLGGNAIYDGRHHGPPVRVPVLLLLPYILRHVGELPAAAAGVRRRCVRRKDVSEDGCKLARGFEQAPCLPRHHLLARGGVVHGAHWQPTA